MIRFLDSRFIDEIMPTSLGRFRVAFVVAALAFVSSAIAARALLRPTQRSYSPQAKSVPDVTDKVEHQLVLVYIGRESCVWCRRPELPEAIDTIRTMLRRAAVQHQYVLRQLAIGLDSESGAENGNLSRLGGFDETSIGAGWLNSSVTRFVTGDLAGPPATPQLILYSRVVKHPGPINGSIPAISDEALLVRKVGLPEILAWAADGAALPRLPSASAGDRKTDH